MDVTCTCGTTFQARSAKARYCSDRCRKRKGKSDALAETVVDLMFTTPGADMGSVEKATTAELEAAGRLDSTLGQTCLVLARRLDAPGLDTGSAISSVAGKLETMLASATRGAGAATSPQQLRDELAERRKKHA